MIVAITPRQWTGLLKALEIGPPVAALEARLGVSFERDEGARFTHRGELFPLVETAVGGRSVGELGPVFDKLGVCWSVYRTLAGAVASEPKLFADNPIFSNVAHAGGAALSDPRRRRAPAGR